MYIIPKEWHEKTGQKITDTQLVCVLYMTDPDFRAKLENFTAARVEELLK